MELELQVQRDESKQRALSAPRANPWFAWVVPMSEGLSLSCLQAHHPARSTMHLPAHLETVHFKCISKAVPKNKKGGVALKNRTLSKGARCLCEWLMDNLKHLIEVSIYNNYACQCQLLWRKEEVVWVNYLVKLRPGTSQRGLLFFPLLLPTNWSRGQMEVRRRGCSFLGAGA